MLGAVGRITILVLVLLVVALALRVLFVDTHGPDELEPLPKVQLVPLTLPPPPKPVVLPQPPARVIDDDPDLDQSSEPADCQGNGEAPTPEEPAPPEPH